jgi:hypothetical protein
VGDRLGDGEAVVSWLRASLSPSRPPMQVASRIRIEKALLIVHLGFVSHGGDFRSKEKALAEVRSLEVWSVKMLALPL